jgi:hypothetical protein
VKQSFADVHAGFMYYSFSINCILNFGLKQVPLYDRERKLLCEAEKSTLTDKQNEFPRKALVEVHSAQKKCITLNTYNLFIIQHTSDFFSTAKSNYEKRGKYCTHVC